MNICSVQADHRTEELKVELKSAVPVETLDKLYKRLHDKIRSINRRKDDRLSDDAMVDISDLERENQKVLQQMKDLNGLINGMNKNLFSMNNREVRNKLQRMDLLEEFDRIMLDEQYEYDHLVSDMNSVNDFIRSSTTKFDRQGTGRDTTYNGTHNGNEKHGATRRFRLTSSILTNRVEQMRLSDRDHNMDKVIAEEELPLQLKYCRKSTKRKGSIDDYRSSFSTAEIKLSIGDLARNSQTPQLKPLKYRAKTCGPLITRIENFKNFWPNDVAQEGIHKTTMRNNLSTNRENINFDEMGHTPLPNILLASNDDDNPIPVIGFESNRHSVRNPDLDELPSKTQLAVKPKISVEKTHYSHRIDLFKLLFLKSEEPISPII